MNRSPVRVAVVLGAALALALLGFAVTLMIAGVHPVVQVIPGTPRPVSASPPTSPAPVTASPAPVQTTPPSPRPPVSHGPVAPQPVPTLETTRYAPVSCYYPAGAKPPAPPAPACSGPEAVIIP